MKGGGGQWTVVVASLVMVVVVLAAMPQTAQAKAATDPRLAVLASCLNAVKLTGVRPETCNKTVSDLVTVDVFEAMFKHRNDPTAHAQGFWTFDSFMDAAKIYEPLGFGSIGGLDIQNRELAAFFAHVAHSTSCGWSGAKDGPYAWGLCYNQELAPDQLYCKESLLYPCVPGVGYQGRGAFPIYWNYNYGPTGIALNADLLHHPEILTNNATLAFQAAVWYWMTPALTRPSPHQIMIGEWQPTKSDTMAHRLPGFGMTINVMAGDEECGHGEDPRMGDRIGTYQKFLTSWFGNVDPGENIDCGLQGVVPLAYAAI
jgi:hypothetical protein